MFPMGSQNQQFLNGVLKPFVWVHIRISMIVFGNCTKAIVTDKNEKVFVFCPHKLIVKFFKCALSFYRTKFNFFLRLPFARL